MAKQIKRSATTGNKTHDARKARKFVEELAWLISMNKDIDFKAIPDLLMLDQSNINKPMQKLSDRTSNNANINFLVGILPGMFTDEKLFASNEDIADFASMTLGVKIPRWEKKSKYELIGHIVCNAVLLDDKGLELLSNALSLLASGDARARKLVSNRKTEQRNWNEIIQLLTPSY